MIKIKLHIHFFIYITALTNSIYKFPKVYVFCKFETTDTISSMNFLSCFHSYCKSRSGVFLVVAFDVTQLSDFKKNRSQTFY